MSKYRDIPRQSPPPMLRAEMIDLIMLCVCTGVWLWLAFNLQIGR